MYDDALVFGLVGSPVGRALPELAVALREVTLSWSRYGYRGRILEGESVDGVLAEALEAGYRWCLVQAAGHVILETWDDAPSAPSFEQSVDEWAEGDFLVRGSLTGDEEQGFGLDCACLLVDLARYEEAGRPAFGAPGAAPVERVRPVVTSRGGTRVLSPSAVREVSAPSLAGWNLLDAALRNGLPVLDLGPLLAGRRVALGHLESVEAQELARYVGEGIRTYSRDFSGLPPEAGAFVTEVGRQVASATRGIFLWNLEPYDDVLVPPDGFAPPLTTLYSVASGFKPNAILASLGFDEDTRVVFFDYSAPALEARRLLVAEWDGEDFPAFARHLFRTLPAPAAHYHLPAGATPETVGTATLERAWRRELDLWGGDAAFREHWGRYRALRHEFVHCDVLRQPAPLLRRIENEEDAVIWWSNAFFTVAGNWLYGIGERRRRYGRWVDGLAEQAPDLHLYGSDFCNSSVNNIRAGQYQRLLLGAAGDGLVPLRTAACEIRF